MANRHLARSVVLQTLFAGDFQKTENSLFDYESALRDNVEEFAAGLDDLAFAETLLTGINQKRSIIDELIQKAAPEWPIEKISGIDRNALRLGIFELVFGNHADVPPKVAINEAIELAKAFGSDSSGRFVYGVLGAIYKEIGEPGKEQMSKRKVVIPNEQLPIEEKAGAIIYSFVDGQLMFCMVHDVFGFWTLSKGSVLPDMTPETSCVTKIMEEISVPVTVESKLGENEYIANHPTNGRVRKHVHYFLARGEYVEPKLEEDPGGLNDVRWFKATDAVSLRMYDDVTQLMAKAIETVLSSSSESSEMQ